MRIVDLFSGAGGMTFGFYYSLKDGKFVRNNDCEIVFANEKDKSAAEAFKLNFPDIKLKNCDIKNISEKTVKELIGTEEIDVIIGGPPCQSFTTIGVRKYDDKAKLYKEYRRMLKIIKPKIFIYENVKGILSMKDGTNRLIMSRLFEKFETIGNDLGYSVSYKTLNAVDYGVPQYRERVFIVGTRKDINIKWEFPNKELNKITIKEAISDLPRIKQGEKKVFYINEPNNNFQKLMRSSNETFTFHQAALHKEKINIVIKNVKQGKGRLDFNKLIKKGKISKKYKLTSGYNNTYGRLISKRPCTTITHNMSTPSSLRCIHYSQNRALTPREGARIQSFPDWFHFFGSLSDVKSQIGNAVPPLLAMELYEQTKIALNGG